MLAAGARNRLPLQSVQSLQINEPNRHRASWRPSNSGRSAKLTQPANFAKVAGQVRRYLVAHRRNSWFYERGCAPSRLGRNTAFRPSRSRKEASNSGGIQYSQGGPAAWCGDCRHIRLSFFSPIFPACLHAGAPPDPPLRGSARHQHRWASLPAGAARSRQPAMPPGGRVRFAQLDLLPGGPDRTLPPYFLGRFRPRVGRRVAA